MNYSTSGLCSLYLTGLVVLSLLATPGVTTAVSAAGNTDVSATSGNSPTPSSDTAVVIIESAGDPNDNIVTDKDQFQTLVQAQSDEHVRVVLSKNATYQPSSDVTTTGDSAVFNLTGWSDAAGVWGVYVRKGTTVPTVPEANESLNKWADARTAVLVANTSTVRDIAADDVWRSSDIRWRGSRLFLKSDTPAADAGDTWAIFELNNDDLEIEQKIELDRNAEAIVNTSDLTNRYIIVSDDGRIVTFDGETGRATGRLGSDSRSSIRAVSTRFADQTLQVGVSQDAVETRPDTLYFNSNRGSYNVTVTAANTDGDTLQNVFANATAVRKTGPESVTFQVTEIDETLQLNLSSTDEGRHIFRFNVTDSTAQDAVAVFHIPAEAVRAGLQDEAAATPVGGVVRVPIRFRFADQATVYVGSRERSYLTAVDVEDSDGDGVVVLRVNTWLAGRSEELNDRAFSVDDGRVRETTLHTEPISAPPLDPSAYEVNVTVNGRQKDTGSIAVRSQSVEEPELWTAPGNDYDQLETVGDVRGGIDNGAVTRADTVAHGDVAVLALTGPGLLGAIEANSNASKTKAAALADLETTTGNPVVHVRQQDPPPNQDPARLDLERTAADDGLRILTDRPSGTVYLVVRTDRAVLKIPEQDTRDLRSDDEMRVNLTLGPDYGVQGSERSATQDWEMTERRVTFDAARDGPAHVRQAGCQVVSGQTSLAPGTELVLRAHGKTDETLIRSERPVVDRDGRFNAQLNFSSVSANETFDITVADIRHEEMTIEVRDVPPAAVQFAESNVTNGTVQVDAVRLPSDGFIALYDADTLDGLGASSRLEAGTRTDIAIELNGSINGTQTVVAVVHDDTNRNRKFDGVDVDRPFYRSCGVVGATANVTEQPAAGGGAAPGPTVSGDPSNKANRSAMENSTASKTPAESPMAATDDDSVESISRHTEQSVGTAPATDVERASGPTASRRPIIIIGGTIAVLFALTIFVRRMRPR